MKNPPNLGPVRIVLASASPRREEMLRALNIRFQVFRPRVRESWSVEKNPGQVACELAIRKAQKCPARDALVIAMDTLVVIDQKVLGKPVDVKHAEEMLQLLSGKSHRVVTGVALRWKGQILSKAAVTEVRFRRIQRREIDWYIQTGEPFDKAGGYAIQGYGRIFIHSIKGCYYNVVGFPLDLFQRMLRKFGLSILDLKL